MSMPFNTPVTSPAEPLRRPPAASRIRPRPAPWLGRPLRALLQRLLDGVVCGTLEIVLPGGETLQASGAAAGPAAVLVLHRWRALRRLLLQGDLGFAEAYRDGDWSTRDLTALLEFGSGNEAAWGDALEGSLPARAIARLAHLVHGNTRRGSRSNIAAHYDLGNDFYAAWLDPSMLYSSAWYATGRESLEAAQADRLDRVLDLLDAAPEAEVLEIGCGWGALAIAVAQRAEARVTGITLSARQLEFARARVIDAGYQQRVELRLEDYRDTAGRYDRIVSLEMIEAVGQAYWPVYFDTLRSRLKPGGSALLQAITIDEPYFDRYARNADFIQAHIFPGGMLPTVDLMREHAARSGLVLTTELRFGASYALTLAEWRRRFIVAWPTLAAQGFDERFRRLWEYYLCYCEAGFRSGRIDVGLYRLRAIDGA